MEREGVKEGGGMDMDDSNSMREMQVSIAASSMFPGFRFSPTDEELISYYLKKKLEGYDKCVEAISEIEIWKHEPWDLPAKAVIKSDEEWFFFSPRGRKYPNGSQSRRATESGYWKATGKERNVKSGSNVIGTKRTLVFHSGRAPKGERTEWIMHEYCMCGKSQDSLVVCHLRRNSDFRLNEMPRRRSQNQGDSSIGNTSDVGTELMTISGGAKAMDCCSKECSSSYNNSVEQIDSGSESEEKLRNEISQHGSSSQHQDNDDEDDCFADIMKDDIIKLDETITSDALQMNATESGADQKSIIPVQGTASRRIRLYRTKFKTYHAEPSKAKKTAKDSSDSHQTPRCFTPALSGRRSPKSLLSLLAGMPVHRPRLSVLLMTMTVLVLLVSCWVCYNLKEFYVLPCLE